MRINKNNLNDVFRSKLANIETMELKGYELIKELFVDSSGFGASDEPALTKSQFEIELESIVNKHKSVTTKITNTGQFQVYVGVFTKTGTKKAKIIGNNTLKITYSDTKQAIRLHNTDIITYDNGKIILNSGGYETKTTKDRLNKYLPSHLRVYQNNFQWFIDNQAKKLTIPFFDGINV